MTFSDRTQTLLASLEQLAGSPLRCAPDLGLVIEQATLHNRLALLDEASFFAKFITRTYGIMQRIGKNGNGYDRLSAEFTGAATTVSALLGSLVEQAPEGERTRFTSTYLSLSQNSFTHFIDLCSDLSWYKNRLIDASSAARSRS